MDVIIVADRRSGAAIIADAIAALINRQPAAALGLATGSSPEPIYEEMTRRHEAGVLDLAGVRAFLLDEYVGLPPSHPASYRSVIRRQVVDRLGLDPGQVTGPDGNAADVLEACRDYEAAIQAAGGIDLQLLGIGSDGHIGFNEPSSSLGSRTRLKTLTAQTRADNARFFDGNAEAVPQHVLTQGLGTIVEARHLVLVAWGAGKAAALARCVEGPVTAMVPASVLQLHPHVSVVVDDEAAAGLSLADYYRSVFATKPAWQGL
ncbi:MAG: glucosamine-6-phosphate deaminase [Actinomycetes bacterium]